MVQFKLNPSDPSAPRAGEIDRLDRMSSAEIERNAAEDPDNPPMTQDELERVAIAREVQRVRKARGMSQATFAKTYAIALPRLRDWEQGRFRPDSVALAYLETIRHEPEAVARALSKSAGHVG